MTPGILLEQARAEGLSLSLASSGSITVTGNSNTVRRWTPVLRANKAGIVAALAEAANDGSSRRHYRWLILISGRAPFEVRVLPECTAAEMEAQYPGAVVEALADEHASLTGRDAEAKVAEDEQ